LSIDVDGRVLRFDSLSKILSAGLRLGWVTGPKEFVDRIVIHTMVTNLQVSGVPQAMAATLLNHWGHDGFFKHVDSVSEFYREKRDVFLECAERRLKGLAEWVVPEAGK
jgi:kynurenine/2-aminoadipate aminotransferase